ncbi:transmembrane protein 182-like [Pristis pectinata]|uniref:transmembrane protein 182-like n=1 Tax=Pristis pectinata TaxID=685728 RepID=UPI00223D3F4A|nr:transmembrane protein 182-like [Pristis pectinata]
MKNSSSKVIVVARLLSTLGIIFSLLTFCTNCWLLATETCVLPKNDTEPEFSQEAQVGTKLKPTQTLDQINKLPKNSWNQSGHGDQLERHIQQRSIAETMKKIKFFPGMYSFYSKASAKTFHYEGFFWSCAMRVRHVDDSFSSYVFYEHAVSKSCIGAYHLPFPTRLNQNSSAYDSATGYRHSWSVLIVLSVLTIGVGFGLIVYEALQGHDSMYILGGGFFLLAGTLSTFSIIMYIYWIQALVAVMGQIIVPNEACLHPMVKVQFGWSFMVAPVGTFFSIVAGLLFLQVGYIAQKKKKNMLYSLPIDKVGDDEL